MPARRWRAWLLSAFCLAVAFVLALPVCFIGLLLIEGWLLGDLPPGRVVALVSLLIAGLVGVGVPVALSVALLAGDRFVSLLWRGLSSRPRFRLRTLVGSVAALSLCLGLIVFADRSGKAYRTARAHEDQAIAYRWLQGIDSGAGKSFWPRPPDPKLWSARQLGYYRAMERHHDGLRRKYDAAAYRPWLSVPPESPEPREPDWRLDALDGIPIAGFLGSYILMTMSFVDSVWLLLGGDWSQFIRVLPELLDWLRSLGLL